MLHANVGGHPDHDSYAPCSVADLAATGLDYWALGHVHTRQVLQGEDPAVVYPGNPQGRHPGETGPRGVYLVEVDDRGGIGLDFRPTDVVRWELLGGRDLRPGVGTGLARSGRPGCRRLAWRLQKAARWCSGCR